MGELRLADVTSTYDGTHTTMSCDITFPDTTDRRLWVRTTGDNRLDRADSFAALALLPAMKLGAHLLSASPVSRTLLEAGFPAIQRIHSIWGEDTYHPRKGSFTPIGVTAPAVADLSPGPGVGVFFSGGVDSSFSLLDARSEVTDLVFIQDFEAPFPPDQRVKALAGVERVAAAFGKGLIVAETNAKDVFGDVVSWAHYHGAFLTGIALQLQGRLRLVHVPSSGDVGRVAPWGSHPLLDPLWSTTATVFVHDRLDVTRFDKTAAVASDDVLLANLRVCWAPHQNCGWCSKCVRTALTLQSLGRFEPGGPFDRPPVTAAEVARLELSDGVGMQFQHIADHLAAHGRDPDIVRAIRIARSGWFHSPVGRLFRGDLRRRVGARIRAALGHGR